MDRIIKYIFIINFCLLATVFSYNNRTVDYTVEIRDLIFGFFTLVLFVLTINKAYDNPDSVDFVAAKRFIFPVMGLYLVSALYSIIFAYNLAEAVYECVVIFTLIVFLFLAVVNLKEHRTLLKTAVIVTIVLGGYYIYQYFTIANQVKRIGTMGNMNLNSSAFFLLGGLVFYFVMKYCTKKSYFWLILSGLAVCLCVFVIVTLRTRAVYLAVIVAFLAGVPKKLKIFVPAMILMIAAGFIVYRIKGPTILGSGSLYHRSQLWKQVLRQTREQPFFGVGAGNWNLVLPEYARYMDPEVRAFVYRGKFFKRLHNDFLTELSETGWLGFAAFFSMFATALWYSRKNRILTAIILGFIVIACFSFPMERPFHRMMIMLIIAFAINNEERAKKIFVPSRRLLLAFSIPVTVLLLFCLYDYYIRYDTSLRTKRIYQAMNDKQYVTTIFETMKIHPLATIDNKGKPLMAIRAEAWFFLKYNEKSRQCFAKSLEYNPNLLFSIMNLGSLATLAGDLKEARYWYDKALDMYPDFEGVKKALHTVDIFEGKYYGVHMDNRGN